MGQMIRLFYDGYRILKRTSAEGIYYSAIATVDLPRISIIGVIAPLQLHPPQRAADAGLPLTASNSAKFPARLMELNQLVMRSEAATISPDSLACW